MNTGTKTKRVTPAMRAAGLREIARTLGDWPEAEEELEMAARELGKMSKLKSFAQFVSRMKTEDEFGDDQPPFEDWICTLNEVIEEARKALK